MTAIIFLTLGELGWGVRVFFFFYGPRRVAVAQTYIHFVDFPRSEDKLHAAFERIKRAALHSAQEVYGPGCYIDVAVDEGSLKIWLTPALVFGLITTVANYDRLKQNIPMMIDDGVKFSQSAYDTIFPYVESKYRSNVIIQSRKAIPGQLQLLIRDVESLRNSREKLTKLEIDARLSRIWRRLERINQGISPYDFAALLRTLQESGAPGLPATPEQFTELPLGILNDRRRQLGRGANMAVAADESAMAVPADESAKSAEWSEVVWGRNRHFQGRAVVIVPDRQDETCGTTKSIPSKTKPTSSTGR